MKAIEHIQPLLDRVLVEPIKAVTKTMSGIYIPETAQETPKEGRVVAVGPGKQEEPMAVKVGDRVMYRGGRELRIGDEKYLMMYQRDIEAVINE